MDEKVEIGMATVSAKGLIFNGRVYTNAAMIKHQWFEHAGKYGEWQCLVGYLLSTPEHIVLFDMQGVEVATSINNQQHMEATVLETYYDAINNLIERLLQARNQLNKE